MTRARSAVKTTRKRHSEEFRAEVLALADTVGVNAAATQLGLHSSQIYGWRSKAQLLKNRGQIDEEQARELVRLKRQLAEQADAAKRTIRRKAGSDHGNPLKQNELVAHRRAESSLEEHFRRQKRAS